MNQLPLRVLPNTDLWVDLIDVSTARHGIIVVDSAKFNEFVKMLVDPAALFEQQFDENAKREFIRLFDEYTALVEAYEQETGKQWEYEQ